MVSKMLHAKHWQVFLMLFGIPFCIQLFAINFILSTNEPFDTASLELYFKYAPIIMLFVLVLTGSWFWSIGVGLQKIIPPKLRLNVKRFKICLFIPAVYLLFFMWLFTQVTSTIFAARGDVQPSLIFDWFAYIVPFHLFSMFCMLYCLYFIARTIKTAELQRVVNFGDCTGLLFSFWILPIGIWFIQPLINELVATHDLDSEDPKSSFMLLDDDLF